MRLDLHLPQGLKGHWKVLLKDILYHSPLQKHVLSFFFGREEKQPFALPSPLIDQDLFAAMIEWKISSPATVT